MRSVKNTRSHGCEPPYCETSSMRYTIVVPIICQNFVRSSGRSNPKSMTWPFQIVSTTSLKSYTNLRQRCTFKIKNPYAQRTWKWSTNSQDNGQSTLGCSSLTTNVIEVDGHYSD